MFVSGVNLMLYVMHFILITEYLFPLVLITLNNIMMHIKRFFFLKSHIGGGNLEWAGTPSWVIPFFVLIVSGIGSGPL